MKLTIGIIGLGYVGIELATNIKKKNFNVYLFDKDLHKINQLKKGISPLNIFTNKEIKILSKDNIFHTNQIHKKIRFNCDLCEKSYTSNQNLKFHIESVHQEVKHFCSYCNSIFKSKLAYKNHLISKHTPIVRTNGFSM